MKTAADLQAHFGNGEHPHFTRDRWREEVYREDTLRGYWDWVAARLEERYVCIRDSQSANREKLYVCMQCGREYDGEQPTQCADDCPSQKHVRADAVWNVLGDLLAWHRVESDRLAVSAYAAFTLKPILERAQDAFYAYEQAAGEEDPEAALQAVDDATQEVPGNFDEPMTLEQVDYVIKWAPDAIDPESELHHDLQCCLQMARRQALIWANAAAIQEVLCRAREYVDTAVVPHWRDADKIKLETDLDECIAELDKPAPVTEKKKNARF